MSSSPPSPSHPPEPRPPVRQPRVFPDEAASYQSMDFEGAPPVPQRQRQITALVDARHFSNQTRGRGGRWNLRHADNGSPPHAATSCLATSGRSADLRLSLQTIERQTRWNRRMHMEGSGQIARTPCASCASLTHLLNRFCERTSVIIPTNLCFGEWPVSSAAPR